MPHPEGSPGDGARYWLIDQVVENCAQCGKKVQGFKISDGRLICPLCAPAPVWARWETEWEPHRKARETIKRQQQNEELQRQRTEARLQRERQHDLPAGDSTSKNTTNDTKPDSPIDLFLGKNIFLLFWLSVFGPVIFICTPAGSYFMEMPGGAKYIIISMSLLFYWFMGAVYLGYNYKSATFAALGYPLAILMKFLFLIGAICTVFCHLEVGIPCLIGGVVCYIFVKAIEKHVYVSESDKTKKNRSGWV